MPDEISYADVEWKDGAPCSRQFGDIYFSRSGGVDETRHVFLDGNHLKERFSGVNHSFTIIETGFGTGLNFFVTAELWLKHAPKDAQLHFISTEKHPLSCDDLARAHTSFHQYSDISKELLAQYPPLYEGFHRLYFCNSRITLTLLYGDINQTLPKLEAKADAWFLDGFAPAKNADMWNENVLQQVSRLSAQGTTLATYSAAGAVRRTLTSLGFNVIKAKGFGHKRDMLKAVFIEQIANNRTTPLRSTYANMRTSPEVKNAIVIGAGLAGCFASFSLAKRGFHVTLIERNRDVCQEASGNPFAILQPSITAPGDIGGQFNLLGFLHSLEHIKRYELPFSQTGVLHLNHKREGKDYISANKFIKTLDLKEAAEHIGAEGLTGKESYFMPLAGYLCPNTFAKQTLALVETSITHLFQCEAISLEYDNNNWHVNDAAGKSIAFAPTIVIANANDATTFKQTKWLPLKPNRGQLTYLPATNRSQALKTILCHEQGYIIPSDKNNIHTIGATYEPFLSNSELLERSHQRNVEGFERIMGALEPMDIAKLAGRVSFRCTSPDRFPCVGPIADLESFTRNYKPFRRSSTKPFTAEVYLKGLYVSLAHGSRGLISAPLSAEILASYITNESLPIERNLLHAMHPTRWLIRQINKGNKFT